MFVILSETKNLGTGGVILREEIERKIPILTGTTSSLVRSALVGLENGAEDGIRTRDFLLGKEAFYH